VFDTPAGLQENAQPGTPLVRPNVLGAWAQERYNA